LVRPGVDGDQTIRKVFKPAMEVWSLLSYCPGSSLPVEVLAWLAAHLAHLTPPRRPGQGAAGRLLHRRAGRMVGISKTEVGDSMDLLLGPLADFGFCQPDGAFVTTLTSLASVLGRWPRSARRCAWTSRPPGCSDHEDGQPKVLYDAKRHTYTRPGPVGVHRLGDLLSMDGGWPGRMADLSRHG
jgi:hypothetical protein